jgi:hypothetical protein
VVSAPRARRDGLVEMHPALVAGGRALAGQLPADAVVICPERHLLFMLDWFVSQEVRLRPGRVPPERRVRVMPLAFIGRDSPVDRALVAARARPELPPVRSLHPRYVNGFVAVPEPTWQWVLQQLPADLRARFQRWRTI